MFAITDHKGFHIRFENGYEISCQFGTTNYCSRRSYDTKRFFEEREMRIVKSDDCEIAIIKNGDFITGEILEQIGLDISNDEMVAGWVSADNVGKIIAYLVGMER